MGLNLGQIIISTLESVDELPIKKRRGWRKPLHSYYKSVSYTHLRAHETREDRVCRGVG